MSNIRDAIDGYVKRVKELADHMRRNEQATKQSLLGPFFAMLGWVVSDRRECLPEYKEDVGEDRFLEADRLGLQVEWQLHLLLEAKDVGKKVVGYDEQLEGYFAGIGT